MPLHFTVCNEIGYIKMYLKFWCIFLCTSKVAEHLLLLSVDAHFLLPSFNLFPPQCVNRITTVTNDSVEVTFEREFDSVDGANVWTLFFQLPALSYLDPARKRALLSIVLDTLNLPGAAPSNTDNPPNNLDDLCIGTFEFYGLTTFRERYSYQAVGGLCVWLWCNN